MRSSRVAGRQGREQRRPRDYKGSKIYMCSLLEPPSDGGRSLQLPDMHLGPSAHGLFGANLSAVVGRGECGLCGIQNQYQRDSPFLGHEHTGVGSFLRSRIGQTAITGRALPTHH